MCMSMSMWLEGPLQLGGEIPIRVRVRVRVRVRPLQLGGKILQGSLGLGQLLYQLRSNSSH